MKCRDETVQADIVFDLKLYSTRVTYSISLSE